MIRFLIGKRQNFWASGTTRYSIFRDISVRVSGDENRPVWIPGNVPAGAQADQFLEGYYYHHVIGDGGRSRFAELHEANKGNPEEALKQAIDWWRNLPRSSPLVAG